MEPPSQAQPGEIYRKKRPKQIGRKPKSVALAVLTVIMLLVPVGWFLSRFVRLPQGSRSRDLQKNSKPDDRLALAQSLDKILAQVGKEVPPPDLTVGSATLHNREGQVYLAGTVVNRSSRPYVHVHVVFDGLDRRRNPAAVVEADVFSLPPGKTAGFDVGPINPAVRTCLVRSVAPAP